MVSKVSSHSGLIWIDLDRVLNTLALIEYFVNDYLYWDKLVSETFHLVPKLNFKAALQTRAWNVSVCKRILVVLLQIKGYWIFSELDVRELFTQL